MMYAAIAMAAVAAYGQIKTGQAQEANYKSQANMAEFKGRGDAIKYKQQGSRAWLNRMPTPPQPQARAW